MKINFKKLLVSLAIAGLSTVSLAAEKVNIEVGVNVSDKMPRGTAENIQAIMPFSNFLSSKTGANVQLIPERRMVIFKNMIRANYYPFLYINPELASVAKEMGYKPLLKTSLNIDSVIMMRSDSNVNKWSDLYGKEIMSQNNSLVKSIAEAAFYKTGTIGLIEHNATNYRTQRELFEAFAGGKADGIVIRGKTAEQFIEQNPGKYKVALRAGSVPAFMLLVRGDVPEAQATALKNAFLDLNKPENKAFAEFMENSVAPGYVDIKPEDFKVIGEVLEINEPDYKLAKPAVKK